MTYTLDHLFILTDIGAPAGDRLVDLGLTEGSHNTHPGQGTANRRFFFHNAMLELLWVDNPEETASDAIRRTHLLERWRGRDDSASPFGVCLRPEGQPAGDVPFPHWGWQPPYLPDTMQIEVGDNAAAVAEPFIFNLSWTSAPEVRGTEPLEHPAGVQRITSVTLHGPHPKPLSDAATRLGELGIVRYAQSDQHYMTVIFDEGATAKQIDLRPDLPMNILL